MDETPFGQPIPASTTPSNHRRLGILVLVILVLGIVVYGAYRYFGGNLFMQGHTFVLASDGLPLAPAQLLDTGDGTLQRLTVPGQGTAELVDIATSEEAEYYLIGDTSLTVSNLYTKDLSDADAGLTQLTNSTSTKFDLSYDATSGTVAYAAVATEGEETHVMVLRPGTGEEEDLGAGTHPTLLPGGFFVVFQRDDALVSVRTETGDVHELLSLASSTSFAIDGENLKIAIHEPTVGTIQEFSIAGMTGASYLSSVSVPTPPVEMVYVDGKLLRVHTDTADSLVIASDAGEKALPATFADAAYGPYKLLPYHD